MNVPRSLLVFQTAFVGDVILALPLMQFLHERYPETMITALTIPAAEELLANHPAVARVMVYDKRGADRGLRGVARMASRLRAEEFDAAILPHRSLRSALVCRLAGIRSRIGFDASAGRFLLTQEVPYVATDHEILRNLSLAAPLGVPRPGLLYPRLYPSASDRLAVDAFFRRSFGNDSVRHTPRCIAVAPGSVWNTKRWPESSFVSLVRSLLREKLHVVLVGGPGDRDLCARIYAAAGDPALADASGRFSLLESAELLGRCAALVS
ncbi:MAG TPA: glycosyltransferase family 9 protein, partial [Bacteroidota bacterium]|nr:glycosyltransferase family 9 protein [Bacteroidota bacterium]